ncbi:tropomyosin alpha-1 chain-like [Pyrus ussuriensis x Pyrus communis]|uniref:Tropomyosin alpha-1 chain-like n=1 Tax=Pyrus ussuriensis x Pyrus communis TaxID=2448454 RepID=A0A5N5FP28_9ROSA|nr:tropomyosin alpha-1 chain-like [Pyrus ussuriensis x Pyrus communis]
MAGSDARKQLLNLIHDFASEKSHGERRVVSLRKRIGELGIKLEVANAELEEAKRAKEYTEQEIKGYEVELAMNEAAIQTLESRISHTQEEISAVGSEVEALKNKQAASRDEFISEMIEINIKIRRFQESIAGHIHEEEYSGSAEEEDPKLGKEEVTEGDLRELEDMLAGVVSQTTKAEEEYEAEQNTQKQVQQALSACERKVFLTEETFKATKEVRDLTRYPFQEYIGY